MRGFENIEVWLEALERLERKQQQIKCVAMPQEWIEDKPKVIKKPIKLDESFNYSKFEVAEDEEE